MNKIKTNGYAKLLVFFVVTFILIFAVGLVADGWQQNSAGNTVENNSGKVDDPVNDNADENTNGENNSQTPEVPGIQIPEYINKLTGLQTTDILASKRHGAFIFNSSSPLYGISAADMLIEIPIEYGATRFVAMINDPDSIGKIGSIAPSRDYISNVIGYFGAYAVYYGTDGLNNSTQNAFGGLDLSINDGYHYTEFNDLIYSNGNLITSGINSGNISLSRNDKETLPYTFIPFGSEDFFADNKAISIKLPFSDDSITELRFSSSNSKYTLIKNGSAKHDMLTNNVLSFDNCLILYADTITYETQDGCDFVMDTSGGGTGYYATHGTATKIFWSLSDSNELVFSSENGEKLALNHGNCYVAYLKSSLYNENIFN